MAFNFYGSNTAQSSEKKSNVNWEDLNKYIVETANLEERETLVGYVSAIVDLGIQAQEDDEYVSDVALEDEEDFKDDNPGYYFKDGIDPSTKQPARMKCRPAKDQQSIAIAIDFPDIIVDKGQFFGESNPKPLRLWMGNQFFLQNHGMVVGRPTALKWANLDKTRKTKKLSFAQNHICYKMAVASKLSKTGECFTPPEVDKLLGEAFQFAAQVFFKEGKGGSSYYTEYVNFVGALGRGQAKPELITEPVLIGFNDKNKPEHLKEIRSHVINTMKMAKNWEGSPIQKQLEALYNASGSDETEEEVPEPKKEEKKPTKATKKVVEPSPEDDDSDLLPF